MNNLKLITFIIFISIWYSCEEAADPPEVYFSIEFSESVSETISIPIEAISQIGIKKVELWVNGENSNISDSTKPFELIWNTLIYEDSSYHILFVRAYDIENNYVDSDSVEVMVDNSFSFPDPVELHPINFIENTFFIEWSANNDDDFKSYTLKELNLIDSTDLNILYATNTNSDTSFIIDELIPGDKRLYQVTVEDSFGLKSVSNIQMGESDYVWSTSFDYMNSSDWGNSIIEVNDGYWATGVADENIRLIKIDFEAQLVVDMILSDGYGNQIIQSEDGSLFIIGGSLSENSIVVIKTDNLGNELWRRYIGYDGWAYGGIIKENGDLVIIGEQNGSAALFTIDQNGQNENRLFYDSDMDRIISIEKSNQYSETYFFTSVKDYYSEIYTIDLSDGDGSYDVSYVLNLQGYNRSIKLDNNGDLIVTMQVEDNRHQILKVQAHDYVGILWEHTFSSNIEGLYNGFQLNDFYYALAKKNDTECLLIRMDQNGSVIDMIEHYNLLTDFSFTSDGGLIFTGSTSTWGDQYSDTPFIKTSSNLEMEPLINSFQGSIVIFPNNGINDFNMNPFLKGNR